MNSSNETLSALEFSVIRELLADRTVTPMGHPPALAVGPLAHPGAMAASLDETDEALALLEAEGGMPLRGCGEVVELFAAARPEGSVLTGLEILAVTRFCSIVEDVRGRAGGWKEAAPSLAERAAGLPDFRAIVREIYGKIAPGGELEDSASAELGRLRTRIQSVRNALHQRLESILARAGDKILSDSFITERGGRFVIPVRTDAPSPVRGIVHGGSSSGATVFVEPMATVEMNNDLVRLCEQEAAEIDRILRSWTARIRERLGDLQGAAGVVAGLDLAQAKALLARDLRAVRPRLEEGGPLELSGARHPLLERTLAASGAKMVPIDLVLPPGVRTLIVSGPNAGGKTVVLKTTGLLALMAHSGLRVPAEEARFPYLREVLVDIGDRQSIEGSLSTFSAHIQNLARILGRLEPPSLVLIDEIGTGTDPVEGGALAVALLEALRRRGALTIATTHHGPVKMYGIETDAVASASVEFDEATLAPSYRLLQGIAGASSGLAIAERLGLDPVVVSEARERIRPEDREGESYLRRLRQLVAQVEQDRGELDRLRTRLEGEARAAREAAIRSDHERAERFRGELNSALEEFRAGARAQLKGVEDKKEEIRLDKERMRRESVLRREHERLAREAAPAEPLPEDRGARRGAGAARRAPVRPAGAGAEADSGPFIPAPGIRVVVGPFGREGRIESIEGAVATVLVGSARFRVPLSDCHEPDAAEASPSRTSWKAPRAAPVPRDLVKDSVAAEVNLIGLTVEEGLEVLDKFLDDARLGGRPEVRIIHGHGTGRLRNAVRALLARHPHVASHRPGNPNEGGNGATVVSLAEA